MFPQRQQPVAVEPFGSGFAVRYPVADPATVALVRQYQEDLRAGYPGWLSRVEFNHAQLALFVFPVGELPSVVLGRRQAYG